jgi:hypothetical protein
VRFPCVHAVATTPAQRLGVLPARSPSRISLPRYGSQVGLRIVLFEACSAFTRVTACTLALSPYFVTRFTEGFNRFVTSTIAPVASGWSGCRAGLAPAGKAPPLHGARHKRSLGAPPWMAAVQKAADIQRRHPMRSMLAVKSGQSMDRFPSIFQEGMALLLKINQLRQRIGAVQNVAIRRVHPQHQIETALRCWQPIFLVRPLRFVVLYRNGG